MYIKSVKYIKSILDLLNEYYPPKEHINPYSNQKFLLPDLFTAYEDNGVWIICCIDYWVFNDDYFKSLKENLINISKEDGINIHFRQIYVVTQTLQKKYNIQNKQIFIGRADSTALS